MTVKDRVAIVTGGSRGIGEGIVRLFVEHGAKVAIWDLLDEGQAVADELSRQGADVIFQKINITDRAAVDYNEGQVFCSDDGRTVGCCDQCESQRYLSLLTGSCTYYES